MANQQPDNPTLLQMRSRKSKSALTLDLLLIGVIILGAIFRFTGIYWGEEQYLHPDERFLVWVGADISPVKSLGEYFDAANSSLNPNNRGHGFFVYGTLPILVTRYAVEWIYCHSGFNEMTMVGRPLSALCDLLTLLLVYAVGSRQYNRRVGLLSAVFYALAVLPIQLSHFFKEDTFVNFFVFFAIYFAVRISKEAWANSGRDKEAEPTLNDNEVLEGSSPETVSPQPSASIWKQILSVIISPLFYLSIGFGVALGCAMASKLNALPVALMLPAAFLLHLSSAPAGQRSRRALQAVGYLVLAAFVSILVFRIFQPYAFSGPGFFGLKPNPQWVQNIRDQRNQAAGDVDFPPALQWARRPIWFSGEKLTVWGLGLPLGILAWAGFLWMGWRMLKGEWREHALLWGWTAFYFLWQSTQFNPTMRYQLPIYPCMAIFAGWTVIQLWDSTSTLTRPKRNLWRSIPLIIGGAVLLFTFVYAVAFTGLYLKPITRLAASRWIYQNIPGPINLRIQSQEGEYNQPLPFPYEHIIVSGEPFSTAFEPKVNGLLNQIYLAHVENQSFVPNPVSLNLQVSSLANPDEVLAQGTVTPDLTAGTDDRGPGVLVTLDQPVQVEEGQAYNLTITPQTEGTAITLRGDTVANEGEWDDGIPYPLDGYNGYGGIYPQDINFNMYWDDNLEKRERFQRILDQSDYLFITSNRQWGSLPRLAERFPLVTTYYRHLLGCPPEQDIVWCYTVAEPGTFKGDLGFELAEVFEAPPTLGIAQAKYYLGFFSKCLRENTLSECLTLGKSGIFKAITGIELAKAVQATSASGGVALNDQFG